MTFNFRVTFLLLVGDPHPPISHHLKGPQIVMVIQGPSWRQDWIVFSTSIFSGVNSWTDELKKTTKVRLKSFNQSFGLGFSTTESHFHSHDGMLHSGIHGAWTFGFPTRARWEGEQRENETTVAGGCLKVFVCFFCIHCTPPKKLEMFFSIFGASIWWSCKTENSFQNWKIFSPEVFSKWRNGLHPRNPGDLTTFWSNYIRFQVVTIGIQLT